MIGRIGNRRYFWGIWPLGWGKSKVLRSFYLAFLEYAILLTRISRQHSPRNAYSHNIDAVLSFLSDRNTLKMITMGRTRSLQLQLLLRFHYNNYLPSTTNLTNLTAPLSAISPLLPPLTPRSFTTTTQTPPDVEKFPTPIPIITTHRHQAQAPPRPQDRDPPTALISPTQTTPQEAEPV